LYGVGPYYVTWAFVVAVILKIFLQFSNLLDANQAAFIRELDNSAFFLTDHPYVGF
jgi:hypothetical protein